MRRPIQPTERRTNHFVRISRRTSILANLVIVTLLVVSQPFGSPATIAEDDAMRYIQNETVKLGVNMEAGGAIGYFALRSNERNLLNQHDRGRFMQQSYYGDEDDSRWNDKPWRWNPVQGGDWRGNSAVVIKSQFTGDSISITTQPRHWASGELIKNAEMRMHVTLAGHFAHINYRFDYHGEHQHQRAAQELPALFVDYALVNLVFYQGDLPWKNQPLKRLTPKWPNEYYSLNEPWAAYVDAQDWGLGISTDRMTDLTCYRYRGDEKTGPLAAACSYLAPIEQLAIGPGFQLGYDVAITIGQLSEIRDRFRQLAAERRKALSSP